MFDEQSEQARLSRNSKQFKSIHVTAAPSGKHGMAAWFKSINAGTVHTANPIVKIRIFTRRAFANLKDK
jgi:hypothetical protein